MVEIALGASMFAARLPRRVRVAAADGRMHTELLERIAERCALSVAAIETWVPTSKDARRVLMVPGGTSRGRWLAWRRGWGLARERRGRLHGDVSSSRKSTTRDGEARAGGASSRGFEDFTLTSPSMDVG